MEVYVAILTGCAVLYVLVQAAVALRQYLLAKTLADLVRRIHDETLPRLEDTVDALHENVDDVGDVLRHRLEVTDREVQELTDNIRRTFDDLSGLLERTAGRLVGDVGSGLVGKLITGVARNYFQDRGEPGRSDNP